MNDPFRKLKDSLKKTVFNDFSFSEERKRTVKEVIQNEQPKPQLYKWEEETVYHVLTSVQHEKRSGFDISTYLFQMNDLHFKNKEGQLYSLLHLFEAKGILSSIWEEESPNKVKYYSLTDKGKKVLDLKKEKTVFKRTSLSHLLEEASL